ncbi:MAG: hypothetical protein PUC39_10845 [Lachnospiraceae bacterium]|nr:hypothetical protein [Lachnospiraceae bacterium]
MAIIDRMKKRFRKVKKTKEAEIVREAEEELLEDEQEIFAEKQEYVRKKIKQRELTLEDYCDQLIDSQRRLDQKKLEYEQVTAYLTDIQLIDQMTQEEKENVEAVAFKLATLNVDREELKQENRALTQLQFRFMQLHEHEVPEGISHIEEQEQYQSAITGDLQKLEEERVNLKYEERFYLEKLHNLKMITFSSLFIAVIAAGITGFLYTQYIFDILFVMLIILFLLAVAGTVIFLKYRNVNYALAYCRKQQKRAVQLLNKVKIKRVNNQATLDYLYSKYNVGSARELTLLWQQYQNILENEEKYKRSSKELTHYGNLLVKQLQKAGVHDADIWISQPEALLDSREMVEVTHSLNVRRQKLREDMEFDEDVMDLAVSGIREHLQKEPEKAVVVQQLLEPYQIRI